MIAIILGLILIAFLVICCMEPSFTPVWLHCKDEILNFLQGAVPCLAGFIGLIAVFIGLADIKDKREAKKEEMAAKKAEEEAKKDN